MVHFSDNLPEGWEDALTRAYETFGAEEFGFFKRIFKEADVNRAPKGAPGSVGGRFAKKRNVRARIDLEKPPGPKFPTAKPQGPKPPGPKFPTAKPQGPKPPGPKLPTTKPQGPKPPGPELPTTKPQGPKPPGPKLPTTKPQGPKPPGPELPTTKPQGPKPPGPKSADLKQPSQQPSASSRKNPQPERLEPDAVAISRKDTAPSPSLKPEQQPDTVQPTVRPETSEPTSVQKSEQNKPVVTSEQKKESADNPYLATTPAEVGALLQEDSAKFIAKIRELHKAEKMVPRGEGEHPRVAASKYLDSIVDTASSGVRKSLPLREQSSAVATDTERGSGYDNIGYNPGTFTESQQKQIAKSLVMDYIKEYRNGTGEPIPFDEFVAQAAKTLDDIIKERASKGMQIRTRVQLGEILNGGGIKTSFEGVKGTSGRGLREPFEEASMGIPADIPDHLRPVYGYLGTPEKAHDDPQGYVGTYGNVNLTLRSEVAKRTTVTTTDSLGSGGGNLQDTAVPVKLDEVLEGKASPAGIFAASGNRRDAAQLAQQQRDGTPPSFSNSKNDAVGPYIETQIHGGVTPADIEKVTYVLDGNHYTGAVGFHFDEIDMQGKAKEENINQAKQVIAKAIAALGTDAKAAWADPVLRKEIQKTIDAFLKKAEQGENIVPATSKEYKKMMESIIASKGYDIKVDFSVEPKYAEQIGMDTTTLRRKKR